MCLLIELKSNWTNSGIVVESSETKFFSPTNLDKVQLIDLFPFLFFSPFSSIRKSRMAQFVVETVLPLVIDIVNPTLKAFATWFR